ncbi:MAG: Eco57I restriction-modification methylase domain-containing protein [Thermoplasmata archaeon]|nr:Eco57I restriction-modification methylase domain-containing protein [Candidatus Sysuiplasma jiujiangense]
MFSNSFIEIAIVEVDSGSGFSRSLCTQTARRWKENRLLKPLLLFTNRYESFAVIVPGKGAYGEAKILKLADRLYRTDIEVLNSIRYVDNPQELSHLYDTSFFPYEKVREEFFEGYRRLYQDIEKAVRPFLGKHSTSYAQRFLGRLMFLYFLQRKGWLRKNRRFIDTIEGYRHLNELFYESLSREGTDGIPFLNGSLFEREEYMTDSMERKLDRVMDGMFRDAKDFFNQFNFTVDETAPLELEVSIDPALIGTVFENMLPENERGGKGTFYTPLNESSFICRRALAEYLGSHDTVEEAEKSEKFRDGLHALIADMKSRKSEKEVRELRERLLSLRVLDPAVGSGGFLLVIMNEIIALIQEAEAIVGWKSDPEAHKKRILPNLYGFDIESEAIEIARLRLWLSLIIDEKEPEPLPNLDFNIVAIDDSLQLPDGQRTLDQETESVREQYNRIHAVYVNEHSPHEKAKLRKEMARLSAEISKRTGNSPSVIEMHMPQKAQILVMNPPYVRQEGIPQARKKYYTDKFGIDRKSDLYAYFFIRALNLVSDDGVLSVITSDKWLETGYGITLQRRIKDNIVAIYGQRERSFGADINTVVTVCTSRPNSKPAIDFTYLETYGLEKVRLHYAIPRKGLQPGKWFYLRAPKVFMEKILPKLTHKLGDFAEIKFGIKTGANDFFYMKDVSHLYETDYLANPKKFEEWGVKTKEESGLKDQGLIYVENESRERYVIDSTDVIPVVRSPKETNTYIIKKPKKYAFYPDIKREPGQFSLRYIHQAMNREFVIQKGTKKGSVVIGVHKLQSVSNNSPKWYNLRRLDPANLISNEVVNDRHFTLYSVNSTLASDMFVLIYPKQTEVATIFLYMNSSIFHVCKELLGKRMGGGALKIQVNDYEQMPAPDLGKLDLANVGVSLNREAKRYFEEVKMEDRQKLDIEVLRAIGANNFPLAEFYKEYVDLVDDRLIKADRGLKSQGAINDQDN